MLAGSTTEQRRHYAVEHGHKEEGRQEDAHSRHDGAWRACHEVADKGGGVDGAVSGGNCHILNLMVQIAWAHLVP